MKGRAPWTVSGNLSPREGVLYMLRVEADIMNHIWDWATLRLAMRGHPWYAALGHEMRAVVRNYGRAR